MRKALSAIMMLSFTVSMPASADDFCTKLRTIVAAAPGQFAAIKAPAIPGHALMTLPIATDHPETYTDPTFSDVTISLAGRFDTKGGVFFGCYIGGLRDQNTEKPNGKFYYECDGVTNDLASGGGYRFWHPEEASACLGSPILLNGKPNTDPIKLGYNKEYSLVLPHLTIKYDSDPRGDFPVVTIDTD